MQDIKGILKRMKEAFNVATYKDLANELGVSLSAIDSWRARGAVPEKNLLKTSQMTGVSVKWLETGEDKQNKSIQKDRYDIVSVNFYEDVRVSAGYGTSNFEIKPTKIQINKNFLNTLNIYRYEKIDIIKVLGDSMSPTIQDGELVILERDSKPKNGETIIIRIDEEIYIKKFKKIPFSPYFILESENKIYKPIEINTDEKLQMCQIIGVVKAKIKLF